MADLSQHYFAKFKYCPVCAAGYTQPGYSTTTSAVVFKCDSCGFQHFFHANPTTAAVIPSLDNQRLVLVTRRSRDPHKGKFDLPGGFVDYAETPEESLVRELKEEIGLEISEGKLFHTALEHYEFKGVIINANVLHYIIRPVADQEIALDPEENSEWKFVDIDEIITGKVELAWDGDVRAIREYREILDIQV